MSINKDLAPGYTDKNCVSCGRTYPDTIVVGNIFQNPELKEKKKEKQP